jgi:hypothetical protein
LTLDNVSPPSREFKNRKGFMDFLASLMELSFEEKQNMAEYGAETRGKQTELKTYVMESNNPTNEIKSGISAKQYPTDVADISVLKLDQANQTGTFYVDSTDKRFLLLYTNDLAETADRLYAKLIHSKGNFFDRIWLPTEVLRDLSRLSGNLFKGFSMKYQDFYSGVERDRTRAGLSVTATGPLSDQAFQALDDNDNLKKTMAYSRMRVFRGTEDSFVTDELEYSGRMITAAGVSSEDHVSLVEIIRKVYRNLVEDVERNSIGMKTVEGRTLLEGQAFDLVLHRQIDNLERFTDMLLDSRMPFRLWGLRNKVLPNMQKVVAVDLHTGDPIDLEITPSLIRVYLPKKSCGNSVLRLYVNLQHHFDATVRLNGKKEIERVE